jgi:hypothetical protein
MPENRILLVSSDRTEWFEEASDNEQFERFPYSVYAILFNLSKKGWQTCRAGWKTSSKLKALAQQIDTFQPSIIYTYGSTVALNPLLCRRFFCKWKSFKVIHGWDDLYGDIWHEIAGYPGRILMNIMEKLIVTRSDHVVMWSRSAASCSSAERLGVSIATTSRTVPTSRSLTARHVQSVWKAT